MFVYNAMSVTNSEINVSLTADGTSTSASVTFPKEMISPLQISGIGFPSLLSAPSTFLGIAVTSITFDFDTGVFDIQLASAPSGEATGAVSLIYGYTAS